MCIWSGNALRKQGKGDPGSALSKHQAQLKFEMKPCSFPLAHPNPRFTSPHYPFCVEGQRSGSESLLTQCAKTFPLFTNAKAGMSTNPEGLNGDFSGVLLSWESWGRLPRHSTQNLNGFGRISTGPLCFSSSFFGTMQTNLVFRMWAMCRWQSERGIKAIHLGFLSLRFWGIPSQRLRWEARNKKLLLWMVMMIKFSWTRWEIGSLEHRRQNKISGKRGRNRELT